MSGHGWPYNLRPFGDVNAPAFIACVQAAAEAQDRRIMSERTAIAPARIPKPDANPGSFARDPELAARAGRIGGAVRKTSDKKEI